MPKTVALEWNPFMQGIVAPRTKNNNININNNKNINTKLSAVASYLLLLPNHVFAAATENSSWNKLFDKLLELADYADGGIIIFSGATMMFGNRTKAIELLFASSIGYLIIRHWHDINEFLKSI